LRTFLTIIAIFIGSLTLTLTNGIGAGVSSYIDKQLGNVGAENVLVVQQRQDANIASDEPTKYETDQPASSKVGNFSVPVLTEKDLEKIRSTKGVVSAEPQLWATPEYITVKNGEKYKADLSMFIEGINVDLAAGSIVASDSDKYQIILPLTYVDPLGFSNNSDAIGKQVTFGIKNPAGMFEQVEATVTGVQQKALLGDSAILASRSLVEAIRNVQMQGLPESAKDQHIAAIARFDANADQATVDAIKERLRDQGYRAMTIEDQIGIVKDIIGAITTVLNVFAGIALLAASFGIINTLLMAVQERTKEIGLMKAMGMSGAKIFLLFSTEAVLLGFWGSALGVVAGIGIGQVANKIAAESILKDLPGFDLLAFPISSIVSIILIIMAVAFIAGTLPARRAAKQNPIDALRYE
jgi:putative ABC transport system permease protein